MAKYLLKPVRSNQQPRQIPKSQNDQVLKLIERFERYLDEYKRYKEARVRGEHDDMPDNQDRVAAGAGGMVGLRRAVA